MNSYKCKLRHLPRCGDVFRKHRAHLGHEVDGARTLSVQRRPSGECFWLKAQPLPSPRCFACSTPVENAPSKVCSQRWASKACRNQSAAQQQSTSNAHFYFLETRGTADFCSVLNCSYILLHCMWNSASLTANPLNLGTRRNAFCTQRVEEARLLRRQESSEINNTPPYNNLTTHT